VEQLLVKPRDKLREKPLKFGAFVRRLRYRWELRDS
jgi:hypothetical protein